MSSKTFYFGKTEAKTTQQTRAAQADAERAASRLEQLLALEDPTRSFDTNRNVGKETESCATAQPANDEIDSCICELQTLKNRLMQQSALLSQIVNADFELANLPHTLKKRVQEVEEQTNDTEKKLAAVSEEREMLMRQLLIVRQQLQVRHMLRSCANFMNTFRQIYPCHQPLYHFLQCLLSLYSF